MEKHKETQDTDKNTDKPKCTTHHHACDCREWEFSQRIAELKETLITSEKALRVTIRERQEMQTERDRLRQFVEYIAALDSIDKEIKGYAIAALEDE